MGLCELRKRFGGDLTADDSQKTNGLKDCDETNLLYKNLDFISKAYYSAEGIFPSWESAYALIVGQLLIAYFQMKWNAENFFGRTILIITGLAFSFLWFRLVSLNRQHAKYLDHTMKHLEFKLIQKYRKSGLEFNTESSPKNFSLCGNKIKYFELDYQLFGELWPFPKAWKSTWYYRRLLPLLLIFLWLCLMVQFLITAMITFRK